MQPVYVRELINGQVGPNSGATVAFLDQRSEMSAERLATVREGGDAVFCDLWR